VSDLGDLYQELVLDHSRSPRNRRAMADASADAAGYNPLCGDQVHVYVRLDGDTVADVSFEGDGCAISKASASMMTQAVKGLSRAEVEQLFDRFHHLVTGTAGPGFDPTTLGKLAVFTGVADYPVRVKCASLAWHTLMAALAGGREPISTE
jgi:nitrogen fixation NifU-like protein